jgi:hypothetical protein
MAKPKKGVKKTPNKESHKLDMVTITMPLYLLGNVVSRSGAEVGEHYYHLELRKQGQGFILKPIFQY